jgi:acetoin utilization deacetylase AcuC-like enzyme
MNASRGSRARLLLAGWCALFAGSCGSGTGPPVPGSKLKTGFIYQDLCLAHDLLGDFPESPARLLGIKRRLKEVGLLDQLEVLHPPPAPIERIQAIHTPQYVERARRECQGLREGTTFLDRMDVNICGRSFEAAVTAAGGGLGAIDAVMEGRIANAFCAVRPPGHHAHLDSAMGFCLFNNVAIAARYLQQKWKVAKVLIVDWDAHHGNGTQEAFYEDGSVFYFSTHCSPLFPLTGAANERGKGKGEGCILNVPLPRGSGDPEVKKAFQEKLRPAALAWKPDFILISAGFDSQEGELGKMMITTAGFAELTRIVKEIARTCCGGRIVSILEGGYDLKRFPLAVEAHIRALME